MKKIISILLLLSLCISFASCSKSDPNEVSCEDIISAYEDAGYNVFHNHDDPVYYELNQSCYIKVTDPEDPENNYLYITRYFTEEDAKVAAEEREFNPILWAFFGIFGEWRWLHTGRYGDLTYETFDRKMISPLKELVECSDD